MKSRMTEVSAVLTAAGWFDAVDPVPQLVVIPGGSEIVVYAALDADGNEALVPISAVLGWRGKLEELAPPALAPPPPPLSSFGAPTFDRRMNG